MSDLQSLHRSRTPQAPPTRVPDAVHAATRGGGQSLDAATQSTMSARFGHDFSQVRVHTDTRAVESAEALHAEAFTTGSDIVFGGGAFAPDTDNGQRLLAHELTHVVQQRTGGGDPATVSRRGEASEQEAERVAEQIVSGESVSVSQAPTAGVARFGPGDYDPNPTLRLPDGPAGIGHKQDPNGEAGSYGYSKFDRFGPYGMPGFDFGAGVEASGGHKFDLGPYGNVNAQGETGWGVKGNYGAWSDDNGTNNRYGARVSGIGIPGGPPGMAGSVKYDDGHGRSLGLEGQAGTGSLEASFGDDGATLGGGLTAVGGAISANDGHEGGRFGLSAGPSLAGRLHWGQGQDGYRNYGVGADFDIFSLDFTTNDPLRTLARHGLDPTGGMLADALLPNGNVTDSAAGMFGLTTKNADLGTTWDVAKGAASDVYNTGSSAVGWGMGKLDEAGAGVGGAVADAGSWLGGKRTEARAGIRGARDDAYNWGAGRAGDALGGISDAAGRAGNWGAGKVGEIGGGVSRLMDSASSWGSVGEAATGLGSAASGALGWLGDTRAEARQGVRGAESGALGWLGDTGGQAVAGVGSAAGAAGSWAGAAAGQAASGVSNAVSDAAKWLGF